MNHASSECSPVLLCRQKLLGILTFDPKFCWTLLLAACGGSKAILGCHSFSVLPMTSHVVRLGNSHPQAVTSRFLPSNTSKDMPLLSRAGH